MIVGGGFGGLYAAAELGIDPEVRRHARRPPQLPPVPAAALPGRHGRPVAGRDRPAAPLDPAQAPATRPCCSARRSAIDLDRREVVLSDGGPIDYDTLIVATGARHSYFGHDEWAPFAPGLKTHRGRDRDPPPDPHRVRGRRARGRSRPAARVDDVRASSAAGRPASSWPARSARSPRHAASTTSGRSTRGRPDRPGRGDGPGPAAVPAGPLARRRSASSSGSASTVRTATRVIDIDERQRDASSPPTARSRIPARTVLWAAGVHASTLRADRGQGRRRRDRPGRAGAGRAGPHAPRPPGDLRGRRRRGGAVEGRTSRRRAWPRARSRAGRMPRRSSAGGCLGRPYEPFRYSDHGESR